MAVNPNEDTEFNDILRKHGILPPKPEEPREPSPPPKPTLNETLEGLTISELEELGEEANDAETERMVEHFRQERLKQLKNIQNARFGRVYPIGREDYTREVTEASKVNVDETGRIIPDEEADRDREEEVEEGEDEIMKTMKKKISNLRKGTGVVVFLYKDGIPRSDRAFEHIRILAQRHPHTKFVSIVGDKCIPNLPDARLPMLIIYRNGEVLNQLVAWGGDRERKIEELEAVLILAGAIIPQPQPPKESDRRNSSDEDEDESDDEPSSRMRSSGTRTNRTGRNIRTSAKKDEDSDSDFDL
ncbi:thioredoxin-like protein [Abortiporus biennis]|nr:thioredoxin-like protein [Abortiporus biennis]